MQNNQINLINKMFEYNLWANTQLIEICSDLIDEQLETVIEGVYGRIHPTLVHLIRAEGGYLNRVTGSRPWEEDLDWDNMPMSDLRAMAQLSGNRLIEIAGKSKADEVIVARRFDFDLPLEAGIEGKEVTVEERRLTIHALVDTKIVPGDCPDACSETGHSGIRLRRPCAEVHIVLRIRLAYGGQCKD